MRRGLEGLLGRRAVRGPALHPVPKGPRPQCPHGALTFVLPFSVYEVLSSSFISFLPHHSPRRGLGVPCPGWGGRLVQGRRSLDSCRRWGATGGGASLPPRGRGPRCLSPHCRPSPRPRTLQGPAAVPVPTSPPAGLRGVAHLLPAPVGSGGCWAGEGAPRGVPAGEGRLRPFSSPPARGGAELSLSSIPFSLFTPFHPQELWGLRARPGLLISVPPQRLAQRRRSINICLAALCLSLPLPARPPPPPGHTRTQAPQPHTRTQPHTRPQRAPCSGRNPQPLSYQLTSSPLSEAVLLPFSPPGGLRPAPKSGPVQNENSAHLLTIINHSQVATAELGIHPRTAPPVGP